MDRNEGVAEAESTAGSAEGSESDDLALLQALESEESAGGSAEQTNNSQESSAGSPDGDSAEEDGEDTGEDGEENVEAGVGEDGEKDEDEDEDSDEEQAEEPKGRAEKRIAKLIAERGDLRKERDELKAEVERFKSGAPAASGPWDPLAADPDYAQARDLETKSQAEYRSARALLKLLDREPDKALSTVAEAFKLKAEDMTPEKAQDLLEDYMERHEERMTEAKGKRIAREQAIRADNEQAAKMWGTEAEGDMPWLKNPADPRHRHVKAILKTHPWVERIPAGRWLAAAAASKLRNIELREQKAKQKPGTQEKRILPGAGRSTVPSSRPPVKGAQRLALAAKRHQEDPSEESLTEYLGAALG